MLHADPRAILAAAFLLLTPTSIAAQSGETLDNPHLHEHLSEILANAEDDPTSSAPTLAVRHFEPCVGGVAEGFPCDRVDLYAHLPLGDIGGTRGNDIWGWTDSTTGREYALMGLSNGTAFVDITDPDSPIYLGNLATHTTNSTWRDIKTYADHAFIVSEAAGHGMQVFDLTQLRSVPSPPATFTATTHYGNFGNAHNIVINEDSGFAYAVGTNTCSGGLHMIDISTPTSPVDSGCFSGDGYTHDAQCVIYTGPDTEHAGKEICFNSNEDTLTIVDVSDKMAPVQLSRTGYTGRGYTHQSWLTEDQAYMLLDDEGDEGSSGHNTRTYIWDMADLDNPVVSGTYDAPVTSVDHNLYIVGDYAYQANYRSGLRVLDLSDVANANLTEVAFFDIYPPDNNTSTSAGAWSVYPFFASGNVIVSGIDSGLFVLRPVLCADPPAPTGLAATPGGDNQIDLAWSLSGAPTDTVNVYRSFGNCAAPAGFNLIASGVAGTTFTDTTASGSVQYAYQISSVEETGFCESPVSTCSSATTTGACTAPPIFDGVGSVTNPAGSACALDLSWAPATGNCGSSITYSVYRDTVPGFTPSPANRVAEGLAGTSWQDGLVDNGLTYYYVVRSVDTTNGAEDGNTRELASKPTGPIVDGTFTTGAEIGDPILDQLSGTERHIGWELSTARFRSGARSYHSDYENSRCVSVVTPSLVLTPGQSSTLSFWTVYDTEDRYDGGVVEITTDGGASWTQLGLAPNYPNTFRSSSDACGFATGTPSFSGTDLTWDEHTSDLSAFAGQEVRIRFAFSTDGSVTEEGWYIDDLSLTHAQIPGVCNSGLTLFRNGFESGDTTGWSGTGN